MKMGRSSCFWSFTFGEVLPSFEMPFYATRVYRDLCAAISCNQLLTKLTYTDSQTFQSITSFLIFCNDVEAPVPGFIDIKID